MLIKSLLLIAFTRILPLHVIRLPLLLLLLLLLLACKLGQPDRWILSTRVRHSLWRSKNLTESTRRVLLLVVLLHNEVVLCLLVLVDELILALQHLVRHRAADHLVIRWVKL
jgi:hypothetical protein